MIAWLIKFAPSVEWFLVGIVVVGFIAWIYIIDSGFRGVK